MALGESDNGGAEDWSADAGSVRATCPRCGVRFQRQVALGQSIMRSLDKLVLWLRDDHQCGVADSSVLVI